MREEPTNSGDLLCSYADILFRPQVAQALAAHPRDFSLALVLCVTHDSGDGADVLYICARSDDRDASASATIHCYKPFFNMRLISRVKR